MCLAHGHNAVPPVRLKPATPRSRVKLSITEPQVNLFYKKNQYGTLREVALPASSMLYKNVNRVHKLKKNG